MHVAVSLLQPGALWCCSRKGGKTAEAAAPPILSCHISSIDLEHKTVLPSMHVAIHAGSLHGLRKSLSRQLLSQTQAKPIPCSGDPGSPSWPVSYSCGGTGRSQSLQPWLGWQQLMFSLLHAKLKWAGRMLYQGFKDYQAWLLLLCH